MPIDFGEERRVRPLLRMTFSTGRDLGLYGRLYRATISHVVGLCTGGAVDLRRQLLVPGVRTEEGRMVGYSDAPHVPRVDGRYTYLLFLALETRPWQPDDRPDESFIEYAIGREAEDICFHFRGGPMWWFGVPHRSADFLIPYALIADALARAGLPHAVPRAPLTPGS